MKQLYQTPEMNTPGKELSDLKTGVIASVKSKPCLCLSHYSESWFLSCHLTAFGRHFYAQGARSHTASSQPRRRRFNVTGSFNIIKGNIYSRPGGSWVVWPQQRAWMTRPNFSVKWALQREYLWYLREFPVSGSLIARWSQDHLLYSQPIPQCYVNSCILYPQHTVLNTGISMLLLDATLLFSYSDICNPQILLRSVSLHFTKYSKKCLKSCKAMYNPRIQQSQSYDKFINQYIYYQSYLLLQNLR